MISSTTTSHHIGPHYRFHTIIGDPDEHTFAIAAHVDYLITSDPHFQAIIGSDYKPQPITPEDFIHRYLAGEIERSGGT